MTDVFKPSKRSEIMSRVKGRGNASTEQRLARLLREHELHGWRRGFALFGNPDFVYPRHGVAVFVDGCFWHQCPIHYTAPQSNARFWEAKITRNGRRDRKVNRVLRANGWSVIRVWEHDLKLPAPRCIARIGRAIGRR